MKETTASSLLFYNAMRRHSYALSDSGAFAVLPNMGATAFAVLPNMGAMAQHNEA